MSFHSILTHQVNDQARIKGESEIILEASKPADLILIDVPTREGWG